MPVRLRNLDPALQAQIVLASYGMMISPNANIFYVDSGHAAAGTATTAKNPKSPASTIDRAVGLCTANNGDIIIVMPGHAETVSAAAGLDLDVAGIIVVGIGRGTDQPTITLDTIISADVDVDAANITVVNMHFRANFADITAAIDVNADDFSLLGCRFTDVAADMNALIWVVDAAAGASDRITIDGCHAIALDAANTHFVNFTGTGAGHIVRNNTLHGDWGTACIGGAGVVTSVLVADNVIKNRATDNDSCINFAATATGMCVRNLAHGGAVQANGFTGAEMSMNQNYYGVNAEDLSGILDPIAT